ncbi:hypothetical protein CHCC14820_1879 [Bacillus paralicheniformis]|uniref:Uncharacterized protein n=1 Tax=Bacillus paralicheniformis TaxID=1648923 RepID=A0A6I7TYI3_9BACI|nr:hypothetical protein SC10_B2orf03978 [Bacillus paralicheniformis]OLF90344.1 hypothetical protein B4121_3619 [Bacillus paralicheniformis]OLG08037.1 hypothetical protein B4125_2218 [Bacillus paralicheniformis]OLG11801.1 hypothetical protein B4123_1762 [Bacillus paralicheniformis]OLG11804.1 hypothetical protein B4123_1765 [Bacillus paralicheniformis]
MSTYPNCMQVKSFSSSYPPLLKALSHNYYYIFLFLYV